MASYNTCDPALTSWVPLDAAHNFPIQNLPFGIFHAPKRGTRPAVAIGDHLLDLAELGLLEGDSLNHFMALGRPAWRGLREKLSWLLNSENPDLRDDGSRQHRVLLRRRDVEMRLPAQIGDYVDFYSSLEHATNVGKMFRPANPLMPNWRWLPVGYHGKAGTVVVSGTEVRRPHGQVADSPDGPPRYAPCERLDIELETGFFVGHSTRGDALTTAAARDSIFGMVLLNDWSARDVQRWEYQPLGPFLAKSFLTSISPWVVTLDALEPFRCNGPAQEPAPLAYLAETEPRGFDIHLEVLLHPPGMPHPVSIARTNFGGMYWSMAQQLAHLTSNGAAVRAGDLCGSGTVSGPAHGSEGSLLELTLGGAQPITLPDGSTRAFLHDGDTVILRGWCDRAYRIGFGDVRGKIVPA